jgi:hypothetical protein
VAGKIIADTIEASGSQISLNVGNVTVLTASSTGLTLTPTTNVNINITSGSASFGSGNVSFPSIAASGDLNTGIFFSAADTIDFAEGGTATGQFDSSGNFKFNSGYGSVATAYACRAWVNFQGIGTLTIRASGNVSSITDNAEADYTVNFTNAMPDANYCVSLGQVSATVANDTAVATLGILVSTNLSTAATTKTTTALRLLNRYVTQSAQGILDGNECNVAIFR